LEHYGSKQNEIKQKIRTCMEPSLVKTPIQPVPSRPVPVSCTPSNSPSSTPTNSPPPPKGITLVKKGRFTIISGGFPNVKSGGSCDNNGFYILHKNDTYVINNPNTYVIGDDDKIMITDPTAFRAYIEEKTQEKTQEFDGGKKKVKNVKKELVNVKGEMYDRKQISEAQYAKEKSRKKASVHSFVGRYSTKNGYVHYLYKK
jgi:hypothetical protein